MISCDCFKRGTRVEIKVSVAESRNDSAPRRPKQQQPPRGRIHINVAHSWKKKEKSKAKQKHLSLHACTFRRMSKGGVWPPATAPLTYFPCSVPPHFITLQKLHDAFVTFHEQLFYLLPMYSFVRCHKLFFGGFKRVCLFYFSHAPSIVIFWCIWMYFCLNRRCPDKAVRIRWSYCITFLLSVATFLQWGWSVEEQQLFILLLCAQWMQLWKVHYGIVRWTSS